jgi:hypothetical protein
MISDLLFRSVFKIRSVHYLQMCIRHSDSKMRALKPVSAITSPSLHLVVVNVPYFVEKHKFYIRYVCITIVSLRIRQRSLFNSLTFLNTYNDSVYVVMYLIHGRRIRLLWISLSFLKIYSIMIEKCSFLFSISNYQNIPFISPISLPSSILCTLPNFKMFKFCNYPT